MLPGDPRLTGDPRLGKLGFPSLGTSLLTTLVLCAVKLGELEIDVALGVSGFNRLEDAGLDWGFPGDPSLGELGFPMLVASWLWAFGSYGLLEFGVMDPGLFLASMLAFENHPGFLLHAS